LSATGLDQAAELHGAMGAFKSQKSTGHQRIEVADRRSSPGITRHSPAPAEQPQDHTDSHERQHWQSRSPGAKAFGTVFLRQDRIAVRIGTLANTTAAARPRRIFGRRNHASIRPRAGAAEDCPSAMHDDVAAHPLHGSPDQRAADPNSEPRRRHPSMLIVRASTPETAARQRDAEAASIPG